MGERLKMIKWYKLNADDVIRKWNCWNSNNSDSHVQKGGVRGLNVQTSFYNRFTMRSSLGDNAYLGVHVYGPILRSGF